MDRTGDLREVAEEAVSGARMASDDPSKPNIEPDSWQDITEFVDQFDDQFDDPVFGVLADPDDPESYWIVKEISKVRPAAVPIDQPPTFDMEVLGPSGKVVDEIRLTIQEIEHVRAAEPTGPGYGGGDEA